MGALASFWQKSAFREGAPKFMWLGVGLMLGWTLLFAPLNLLSLFDEDLRREQRLLHCLQEAGDKWIGQMCRYSFDERLMAQFAADQAAAERRRQELENARLQDDDALLKDVTVVCDESDLFCQMEQEFAEVQP